MKTLLIILMLFFGNICYAQEVITEFNNETVSVVNEELRILRKSVETANSDISGIDTIPSGVIVMWHGSIATIPSGWYLCNGANGTPDLRDRFIIAATADNSGVANTNVTGSLTQSGNGTIPAHTHSFSSYTYPDSGATLGEPTSANCMSTRNTSSYGTGTKNIAVYYALAFIQKS